MNINNINNNFNTVENNNDNEGSFISDNKINYTEENKIYSKENYQTLNTDINYRKKYDKNFSNSNEKNKANNIDLFSLSSKFFNECRNKIKKNEYFELIECLKKFNMNELDPKNTSMEIENILKDYEDLRRKFREIFKKMCHNK